MRILIMLASLVCMFLTFTEKYHNNFTVFSLVVFFTLIATVMTWKEYLYSENNEKFKFQAIIWTINSIIWIFLFIMKL